MVTEQINLEGVPGRRWCHLFTITALMFLFMHYKGFKLTTHMKMKAAGKKKDNVKLVLLRLISIPFFNFSL